MINLFDTLIDFMNKSSNGLLNNLKGTNQPFTLCPNISRAGVVHVVGEKGLLGEFTINPENEGILNYIKEIKELFNSNDVFLFIFCNTHNSFECIKTENKKLHDAFMKKANSDISRFSESIFGFDIFGSNSDYEYQEPNPFKITLEEEQEVKHSHYKLDLTLLNEDQLKEFDLYHFCFLQKMYDPSGVKFHVIKKLMFSGRRGVKDENQDINEAIDSLQRLKEIMS